VCVCVWRDVGVGVWRAVGEWLMGHVYVGSRAWVGDLGDFEAWVGWGLVVSGAGRFEVGWALAGLRLPLLAPSFRADVPYRSCDF
jgi:hypothetical protein